MSDLLDYNLKNLKNLSSEIANKEKLENIVKWQNTAIEQFKKEFEAGQAEGENIHITDSGELPMIIKPRGNLKQEIIAGEEGTSVTGKSIHAENIDVNKEASLFIGANTEQDSRQGYNKLKVTVTTTTINGINFKINEDKSIVANGTASENAILTLDKQYTNYSADTYKLTGCPANGREDTYRLDLIDENDGVIIETIDTGNGAEFTLNNEKKAVGRIRIEKGVTVNNLLFKPMLVTGTEEKLYEQFGKAPSFEFESPIQSVKGSYSFLKQNKNLFNNKNIELKTYYNNKGERVTSINWGILDIPVIPNKNYYLSGNNVQNNIAHIVLLDRDKKLIKVVGCYAETHLIKTTSETAYIGISVPNYTDETGSDVSTIKLEQSSVTTDYVEHKEETYNLDFPERNRIK